MFISFMLASKKQSVIEMPAANTIDKNLRPYKIPQIWNQFTNEKPQDEKIHENLD